MTYPPDPNGYGWGDVVIALIFAGIVAAVVLICIVVYRIATGM